MLLNSLGVSLTGHPDYQPRVAEAERIKDMGEPGGEPAPSHISAKKESAHANGKGEVSEYHKQAMKGLWNGDAITDNWHIPSYRGQNQVRMLCHS